MMKESTPQPVMHRDRQGARHSLPITRTSRTFQPAQPPSREALFGPYLAKGLQRLCQSLRDFPVEAS